MSRLRLMKETATDPSRRATGDDRSTAELFLAWLAMPELGTPVHGPARAGKPPMPSRNARWHGRRPERSLPRLAQP